MNMMTKVRRKRVFHDISDVIMDLQTLTKADCREYEVGPRECQRIRSRIYSINSNNATFVRYRSMYNGKVLKVIRFD